MSTREELLVGMVGIIARGEHAHPDKPAVREAAELLRVWVKDWNRRTASQAPERQESACAAS